MQSSLSTFSHEKFFIIHQGLKRSSDFFQQERKFNFFIFNVATFTPPPPHLIKKSQIENLNIVWNNLHFTLSTHGPHNKRSSLQVNQENTCSCEYNTHVPAEIGLLEMEIVIFTMLQLINLCCYFFFYHINHRWKGGFLVSINSWMLPRASPSTK